MSGILDIQEFFIEGSQQEKSHVLLHIAEPSTSKEREKGYFFALVEIKNSYPEQIMKIQEIIDNIEEDYYNEENQGKNLFADILNNTNETCKEILNYPDSKLHCIIGTLRDKQLSISYHGEAIAVLFYPGKEELKQTFIINPDEKEDNVNLFSAMIEGEIHTKDCVLFATPGLQEYFTIDRIRKILSSRNTKDTNVHIQKVLTDLRSENSFAGTFLHLIPQKEAPKTGRAPKTGPGSEESLNKLLESTRTTEETLAPPLFGQLNKKLKNWQNRQKNHNSPKERTNTNYRPKRDSDEELAFSNTILIGLGKILVIFFTSIIFVLSKILKFIQVFFLGTIYFISNRSGAREKTITEIKHKINHTLISLKNLPLLSKIILGMTLIFAIAFTGSILITKAKEEREARLAVYNNQIQAIIDKKDAAEAKLIYNHEDEALLLIKEAKEILDKLPESEQKEQEKKSELNSQLEQTLLKLRKITEIQPEKIINLSSANPVVKTEKIVKLGEKLIAFGKEDSNLYNINYLTGSVETRSHSTLPNLALASVPKEDDKIVFITSNGELTELNKENNSLSSKTIDYPVGEKFINATFVYNRRLYTVDIQNKQIYKHNQTQLGYDKGTGWLELADGELETAVSLAIDGDLFVLIQKGKILKYSQGKKMEFEIKGLDPKLENPSSIWTYNGVDHIYILEPNNKRVIMLDKTGNFVAQYTSQTWKNPSDFIVDVENNKIFVLDDNIIYSFIIQ